jgi:exodeoxyribonuclease V gamma subunit
MSIRSSIESSDTGPSVAAVEAGAKGVGEPAAAVPTSVTGGREAAEQPQISTVAASHSQYLTLLNLSDKRLQARADRPHFRSESREPRPPHDVSDSSDTVSAVTLLIHRSDHPDLLVGSLCDAIAPPLCDPFAPEIIAVPTRGIERWLTERIASRFALRGVGDGIAANIDFPFPHRLVDVVLMQIPDTARSIEAWSQRAVAAHIERIIDDHHSDEWMWLIARFVEGPDGDGTGAQRLRAAQKIARLFTSYARYRPQMVAGWGAGNDEGPAGTPIAEPAAWQPVMWRLLEEQIGVPPVFETLPAALASIRSGSTAIDLPERISVYGTTSPDPVDLAVFEALGDRIDVNLFLLHPSPTLWREMTPLVDALAESTPPMLRSEDPTRMIAKHPLLRSWGGESRELQILLGPLHPSTEAEHVSAEATHPTLLGTLQSDIRANRKPTALVETAGADRSIQIHTCHGAQRQVEVLRDAILHLMADDATLEPRDVVIMTPDLETYAPLIEAAFPASYAGQGTLPDLRVRIADRSPTSANPLLRFAATVTELAASRLSRGTVSQLIGLPEVQRRFGIDIDTAAAMAALVDDANIRWGLDDAHRERNGAGRRGEHTWRRGTDRILTGVFFDDDPIRIVGDIAPLAHVEGQSASAAGEVALLIERLAAIGELLATPEPVSRWAEKIATAVRLLAAPERGDEWQWGQL